MSDHTDNVVRIYGNDNQDPHQKPQELSLPKTSPHTQEIRNQRRNAHLSKKEAAEVCGVTIGNWRKWETGKVAMPRSTWAWFRVKTSGAFVAGGPEWEGWALFEGKLYSPEDWGGLTAAVLRTWPYIHAQLSELRRKVNLLEDELSEAHNQISAPTPDRARALGQLNTLGLLTGLVMNEYEDSPDKLLKQFSTNLYESMKSIAGAGTQLIQTSMIPE